MIDDEYAWRHRSFRKHPKAETDWQNRINALTRTIRHVEAGHGVDCTIRPIMPHEAVGKIEYEDTCELFSLQRYRSEEWIKYQKNENFTPSIMKAVTWAHNTIKDEGLVSIYCYSYYSYKWQDWIIITPQKYKCYINRHRREWDRSSVHAFIAQNHTGPCLTKFTYIERFMINHVRINAGEIVEIGSATWYSNKILILFKELQYYKRLRSFADCASIMFSIGMYWGDLSRRAQLETDALVRMKSLPRFRAAGSATLSEVNNQRKLQAEAWQAEARLIAASIKSTGGAREKHVQRELLRRGFSHRDVRSIRRALAKSD